MYSMIKHVFTTAAYVSYKASFADFKAQLRRFAGESSEPCLDPKLRGRTRREDFLQVFETAQLQLPTRYD